MPQANLTKLFNYLNGIFIPGGGAALYQKDLKDPEQKYKYNMIV